MMRKIFIPALIVLAGWSLTLAEPYLAARSGLKCSVCHINKSGGGKRTDFAVIYAQTEMPAVFANPKNNSGFFDGYVSDAISLGANFRVDDFRKFEYTYDTNTVQGSREPNIQEANLYLQVDLMPEFLTFYLDETMVPSLNNPTATNRELFGMVHGLPYDGHIKVGRMLLPYGLRLMDDDAFIRAKTGYTYGTTDMAVEAGIEPGPLSLIVNLTDTKFSTVGSVVWRMFRLGASYGVNTENTELYRAGVFGTFNMGIFALLGEVDQMVDVSTVSTGTVKKLATFLELNTLVYQGVNVKLTHEFFHPDRSVAYARNGQQRITLGVEPFVTQFLQLGIFYRLNGFVPQNITPDTPTAKGHSENQNHLLLRAHIFF